MGETSSPPRDDAEPQESGGDPGAPGRDAERETDPPVVAVTRSGGFAGLTKVWTAEPRPEEAPVWVDLIERCPWDEPVDRDAGGADRFVWSIHATCGRDDDRTADLPDRALLGPWRALVDAVREWNEALGR